MKHQLLYLLAIGLTCGCTHDAEPSPADPVPAEGTPLEIAGVHMGGYAETRATNYQTFPPADKKNGDYVMGLYCEKAFPTDKEQYNIPYSYAEYNPVVGYKWMPYNADGDLLLHGMDTDVYAYYPWHETGQDIAKENPNDNIDTDYFGNVNGSKITTVPYYYDPAIDFCYGKAERTDGKPKMNGTPAGKVAQIKLDHILIKWQLSLQKGDYPGQCVVSEIKLDTEDMEHDGIPPQASFDLLTKEWTMDAPGPYTYSPARNGTTGKSLTVTADATATPALLLPPFDKSYYDTDKGYFHIKVGVQVDGRWMETKIKQTSLLEAGKFYKVTLLINGTKLDVTSVSIADWSEVQIKDNQNMDFEPYPIE